MAQVKFRYSLMMWRGTDSPSRLLFQIIFNRFLVCIQVRVFVYRCVCPSVCVCLFFQVHVYVSICVCVCPGVSYRAQRAGTGFLWWAAAADYPWIQEWNTCWGTTWGPYTGKSLRQTGCDVTVMSSSSSISLLGTFTSISYFGWISDHHPFASDITGSGFPVWTLTTFYQQRI